ncbi:unnamed protein product [Coregonus sp. 'balchen']|nr:unnamed protein product [Coregonus sp. 'balchen']
MEFSVLWRLSAVLLLCPLYMGVGVLCEVTCSEEGMGMEGGHYTLTKQLEYGSILIYHCPDGYYPFPALTRSCLKSGTWKPAPRRRPIQQCRMVECPNPLGLESGSVLPVQSQYFVNNKTTYECYSGYSLRGSASRVCQSHGKWSGGTPICSRDSGGEDRCADPGIPAGARRSGSSFGIDDELTYRCDDGLNLLGSKTRVCQESGQWTGTEPSCYYKHTYDTALEITEAFGSAIRESLQLAAPIDDTDQEGKKITIDKAGKLNIYIAMDISDSIEEKEFDKARNAVKKLITKVSSFSVSPNYEILFFASDVLEVVNIIDFSGENRKPLEEVLANLDNFKYDARDNVGTNLNLAFRTILERMAIQKQRNETLFKEVYHVLIFFTDGAYNMGGSPENTVAKIREAVHMNKKEERDKYLDIYVFGVGSEIFDEDIMPLVTKRDGEKHYFKHEDGIISKCMGSLVSRRFILTAAHCFKFADKPDKIRVTIGKLQVVNGASRIILHPDYNIRGKEKDGIKEFYDYDVALIQLEKDVDISINIRPICIPCTKETSGALRLVGEATTCKQQEQLLLKNPIEEVSFISFDKKDQMDQRSDAKLKLEVQLRDSCIRLAATQVGVISWGTKDLCPGGSSDVQQESDDESRDFHINLFKVVPFLKKYLGDESQDYEPLQFLDK